MEARPNGMVIEPTDAEAAYCKPDPDLAYQVVSLWKAAGMSPGQIVNTMFAAIGLTLVTSVKSAEERQLAADNAGVVISDHVRIWSTQLAQASANKLRNAVPAGRA